ncbi:unnamed protein product [Lota lota]
MEPATPIPFANPSPFKALSWLPGQECSSTPLFGAISPFIECFSGFRSGRFIDANLVSQAGISVQPLNTPLDVNGSNGELLTHD